jgi:predicted dehydrogenase
MRVAVVGTGRWGWNHARVFKRLLEEGAVQELTVCDANRETAQKCGKTFDVDYVTDYKKLLSSGVDAVSIAVPSDLHYKVGRFFVEAGVDVLLEKPMTLSAEHAKTLVALAEKNDVLLMVGHIFRYHPALTALHGMLVRGELGALRYISSERFAYQQPRKDMGVFFALGIHDVDIFCYLCQAEYPRTLAAHAHHNEDGIDIHGIITMTFDNNVYCYAIESWSYPTLANVRRLLCVGAKKAVEIHFSRYGELAVYSFTDWDTPEKRILALEDAEEPLYQEIANFVHCVRTRELPRADMRAGLRAVEVIEAAVASAKTAQPVKFRD